MNLTNVPEPSKSEYEALGATDVRFGELFARLGSEDGAARLRSELPRVLPPEEAAAPGKAQRVWELCGLYYFNAGRSHEALAIFQSLYEHMQLFQHNAQRHTHKGMPLVWVSDCYGRLNCPVLAKRYLMLTLCEDAILHKGTIPLGATGVYFRLVWIYGMSDSELARYASTMWRLSNEHPEDALFPEWILQELDQQWMQEYPSLEEAGRYVISNRYVQHLLAKLGGGDGKALERLGHYVLSVIPGCRALSPQRSHSTDYDIVCTLEGNEIDFRSELGQFTLSLLHRLDHEP